MSFKTQITFTKILTNSTCGGLEQQDYTACKNMERLSNGVRDSSVPANIRWHSGWHSKKRTQRKSPSNSIAWAYHLAVREGFEPSIRCRIHTFQACSFSHSDTSPFFELLFRRELVTFSQCCGLWLRRTPCVLSFIASFAGLGQPLGHLTVFDSLLKAWNLTSLQSACYEHMAG